mmetsp:Transcript_5579/g.9586  ORF Transcript_5579/g.9586 Transcript_5579/m.9586 type:complete len:357 (-) Transcript_5579:47-1117(-)
MIENVLLHQHVLYAVEVEDVELAALELDHLDLLVEGFEADGALSRLSEEDVAEREVLQSSQHFRPVSQRSNGALTREVSNIVRPLALKYGKGDDKEDDGADDDENAEADHGAQDEEGDAHGVDDHALGHPIGSLVTLSLEDLLVETDPLELDDDEADVYGQLEENEADALDEELAGEGGHLESEGPEDCEADVDVNELVERLAHPLLLELGVGGLDIDGLDRDVEEDEHDHDDYLDHDLVHHELDLPRPQLPKVAVGLSVGLIQDCPRPPSVLGQLLDVSDVSRYIRLVVVEGFQIAVVRVSPIHARGHVLVVSDTTLALALDHTLGSWEVSSLSLGRVLDAGVTLEYHARVVVPI